VTGTPGAGADLRVTLTWAVTQPAAPRPIHFGLYLLDRQLALITQADGPGVDSTEWRPDDLFETTFTLHLPEDLPPGDYAVATALYYYPEIERLPLAGEATDLLFLGQMSF
jgi:hypothetical protein